MASKKGQGSSSNGRNSPGQRLGIKLYGGEVCIPGCIIVRQNGTKVYPGRFVGIGKDDTLYALRVGTVKYGRFHGKTVVNVIPTE